MAYIKLSNGNIEEVDDDELRDLIIIGAGEEVDPPKQPTQTYKEQAPGLLARVKATGYSGLSDDDKKLYDAQYKYSQAARSGMTLEEARQMADDAASRGPEPVNPYMTGENPLEAIRNTAKDSYGAIRTGLATAFSPYLGFWDRFTGVGGNIGSDESYVDAIKDAERRGIVGEGVAGEFANPLNLTMLVPGLGQLAMAKYGEKLGKLGEIGVRGGLGAVEGAGYGAASKLLDRTNEESMGSNVGFGGIVGGGLGLASGLGRVVGKHLFPGLSDITNPNVTENTKKTISKNLDMILSKNRLPGGRDSFMDLADTEKQKIGKLYEEGIAKADEGLVTKNDWLRLQREGDVDLARFTIDMPGIVGPQNNIVLVKQKQLAEDLGLMKPKEPKEYAFSRNLDDIEPILRQHYMDLLAKKNMLSKRTEGLINKDLERVRRSQSHIDKLLPGETPYYSAKSLSQLRTDMTNPETYKDPIAELGIAKRDLGRTWRDVINQELMQDKRYTTIVDKTVPEQYALWSGLEDVVDYPGRLGLGHRLPMGLSISPWLASSTAYKTGQYADLLNKGQFGARDYKVAPSIEDTGEYDLERGAKSLYRGLFGK